MICDMHNFSPHLYLLFTMKMQTGITIKGDIFMWVNFRVWQSKRNLACLKCLCVSAGQFMCYYYEHVLWCANAFPLLQSLIFIVLFPASLISRRRHCSCWRWCYCSSASRYASWAWRGRRTSSSCLLCRSHGAISSSSLGEISISLQMNLALHRLGYFNT